MRRVSWFLFILGLTLGLIFGLYYAWEISPIDPKEAIPSDLQSQYQVEYQTLIALAYVNTGNISRAIRRLETMPDVDAAQSLKALAEQLLAEGRPEEDVLAVAQLAAAMSNQSKSGSTPEQAQITATPTSLPTEIPTQAPTPTQTSTPMPAYQLRSREKVCDPALGFPLIQVLVLNAADNPVPGVEVLVLWDQGEDHFFTGLKPEMGLGYGDFTMEEGFTYAVQISGSSETITGLKAEECIEDEEPFPGSWLLSFEEP
ncbi:MAG: hypothetical protein A2Z14_14140 [Chloroflexi bacterium RBG_16_48_8]|nr:MAG: hypothetical protein A2Z14_14140 [Chloroflexi bacterium RBG_16_48_8]